MLQEDIDGLRKGVGTLLRRKKRPRRVCIRKNHAEELDIPFDASVQVEHVQQAFELFGEPYILVWVKLGDLLQALKGKVGDEYTISAGAGEQPEKDPVPPIDWGREKRQGSLRYRPRKNSG